MCQTPHRPAGQVCPWRDEGLGLRLLGGRWVSPLRLGGRWVSPLRGGQGLLCRPSLLLLCLAHEFLQRRGIQSREHRHYRILRRARCRCWCCGLPLLPLGSRSVCGLCVPGG